MIPTWQTVAAPNFGEASRMIQAAQQNMGAGFDTLNGLLKKQEDLDAANAAVIKNNNTQAFLDQITKFQSTKDFQAAQNSGVFDQMQQQFGDNYDRAAVRAALDGRLAALQGRDVQGVQFKDTMQKADEAPVMRQALVAALNKDTEGFKKIVAENPNAVTLPDVLMKQRDIVYQDDSRTREGVKFDREGKITDATLRKMEDDLLTAKSNRSLQGAQAGYYNALSEKDKEDNKTAKQATSGAKLLEAAANSGLANTIASGGYLGTEQGQKTIDTGIKSLNLDSTQEKDIKSVLADKFKDGWVIRDPVTNSLVQVKIPASTAVEAVKAAYERESLRNLFGSSSSGNRTAEKLQEMMTSPEFARDILTAAQYENSKLRAFGEQGIGNVAVPLPANAATPEHLKSKKAGFIGNLLGSNVSDSPIPVVPKNGKPLTMQEMSQLAQERWKREHLNQP